MKFQLAFFNVIFVALVVLVDQVSKSLVFGNDRVIWDIYTEYFTLALRPSTNAYFAFSIPAPQVVILCVIGIVFLAVLFLWFKQLRNDKQSSLWLALIIGGALGNIVDRFIYGGVIDWIEVTFFSFSWSSFNIADIAIVLGVIGWLIHETATSVKQKRKTTA